MRSFKFLIKSSNLKCKWCSPQKQKKTKKLLRAVGTACLYTLLQLLPYLSRLPFRLRITAPRAGNQEELPLVSVSRKTGHPWASSRKDTAFSLLLCVLRGPSFRLLALFLRLRVIQDSNPTLRDNTDQMGRALLTRK